MELESHANLVWGEGSLVSEMVAEARHKAVAQNA